MGQKQPFGEIIPGYSIPVLNEREIRAAAGILFLATFLALMFIVFKGNFIPIKYIITLFLIDFIIRVLISPKYAPTLIVSRMIVSRQNPEYVGAAQKKLAWTIGLVLSATMFLLMVVLNTYSIITGLICLVCLIFLFFESAFGICLGCVLYRWKHKEPAAYCPGEVCDIKARHASQKTTASQLLVVLGYIAVAFLLGYLFSQFFAKMPQDLWQLFGKK